MSYEIHVRDTPAADAEHVLLMNAIHAYKAAHPDVLVMAPGEIGNGSGLWEVSFPRAASMAFDSPEMMLRCLEMTTLPPEGTWDDDES